jgi:hypothetical protein
MPAHATKMPKPAGGNSGGTTALPASGLVRVTRCWNLTAFMVDLPYFTHSKCRSLPKSTSALLLP